MQKIPGVKPGCRVHWTFGAAFQPQDIRGSCPSSYPGCSDHAECGADEPPGVAESEGAGKRERERQRESPSISHVLDLLGAM